MQRIFSILILLAFAFCRTASAHFLWLETTPAEKPAQVNLWFSETCAPGDPNLLDKVAQTKCWICSPSGENKSLPLTKQITGADGSWSSPLEAAALCIEASCDYGVITRAGKTFLLQYEARHLQISSAADLNQSAESKSLKLQVQPHWHDKTLTVTVVFDGQPAADAQLMAIFPDNEERELKLDTSGSATIDHAAAGDYAFRARVQQNITGQREGQKYTQVRYYSTLTFRLPQSSTEEVAVADASAESAAKTASKKSEPDAAELLKRARANRAVWEHFPGFTANVAARIDDHTEHGAITMDEHGAVTSNLKDEKLRDWVEEQMGSVADHRLPSALEDEKPAFADEDTAHPLGRLIRLGDAKYDSSYRIRDDRVMEVNRRAGPEKFTISVLETERNKEGKYLPRTFSATFWDAKSGEIKTSSSYLNTWKRVGNFDLPDRFLEVETGPGEHHVKEITLDNYHLGVKPN